MEQVVLLKHVVNAEDIHFDWMIERQDCIDEHRLRSWRCSIPIHKGVSSFWCEQIPDHRVAYLEYEGEISKNRGHVLQIARGKVLEQSDRDIQLSFQIDWGDQIGHYQGKRENSCTNHWLFVVEFRDHEVS